MKRGTNNAYFSHYVLPSTIYSDEKIFMVKFAGGGLLFQGMLAKMWNQTAFDNKSIIGKIFRNFNSDLPNFKVKVDKLSEQYRLCTIEGFEPKEDKDVLFIGFTFGKEVDIRYFTYTLKLNNCSSNKEYVICEWQKNGNFKLWGSFDSIQKEVFIEKIAEIVQN